MYHLRGQRSRVGRRTRSYSHTVRPLLLLSMLGNVRVFNGTPFCVSYRVRRLQVFDCENQRGRRSQYQVSSSQMQHTCAFGACTDSRTDRGVIDLFLFQETIEQLVSRDMARRYLHFDIKVRSTFKRKTAFCIISVFCKAFVESNPQLQWCPFPGCGRVVQYPIQRSVVSDSSMAAALVTRPATDVCTWRAVDCGDGHQFCWGCREEAHEPCPCNEWRLWHEKMREMLPKETQRKNGTSLLLFALARA